MRQQPFPVPKGHSAVFLVGFLVCLILALGGAIPAHAELFQQGSLKVVGPYSAGDCLQSNVFGQPAATCKQASRRQKGAAPTW
jgi:hypothetical protein